MTIEFVNHSYVELIDTNATDDMVAMAAWVSFDNDKAERLKNRDGVGKLIDFLWRNNHTSPFEHGIFTFKVSTPIFVAREFMRHRAASYNEMSGRYTIMRPQFYIPAPDRPLIQTGKAGAYTFEAGTNEQYALMRVHMEKVVKTSWKSYNDMLDFGIAKEVARMILPLNTMTQFYVSMNPRNVMHFLGLRNSPEALYEIREVASKPGPQYKLLTAPEGSLVVPDHAADSVADLQRGIEEVFAETMPLTYQSFVRNR